MDILLKNIFNNWYSSDKDLEKIILDFDTSLPEQNQLLKSICYFKGLFNFSKDCEKALNCCTTAKNCPTYVQYTDYSLLMLGLLNRQNHEYSRAVSFFEKSNNMFAMNFLGTMYQFGQGVRQDYTKAVKLFKQAESMGNIYAMVNLGYLYQHGYGIDKCKLKAYKLYYKAYKNGNKLAKERMYYLFDQKDIKLLIDLYIDQ